MSFEVERVGRDKVISSRAPERPEAELVGVGETSEHLAQLSSGCEDGLGEDLCLRFPVQYSKLILP